MPIRIPHGLPRLLIAAVICLAGATIMIAMAEDFPAYNADDLIENYGLTVASEPVSERHGWRKPELVLVAEVGDGRLAWLQKAAPEVRLEAYEGFGLEKRGDEVAAVIGVCNEAVLGATALRWVQIFTAGAEKCLRQPGFDTRKPLLTNMQHISAPVIAEHAIALMLSLARQLPAFGDQQRRGEWSRGTAAVERMRVVQGKTLLVVGLGGIGTQTARRAHALGMRVTATRNSSREGPDFVSEVGLPSDLPRLLGAADVVVNALPLTSETRDLFDAKRFADFKLGALFINVGRGGTVVSEALREALHSEQLGGAGLDVTDPEPLPEDHPLWDAPNLIITPHVAWSADLDREARWQVVRENLKRYARGGHMLSVVDPERGY